MNVLIVVTSHEVDEFMEVVGESVTTFYVVPENLFAALTEETKTALSDCCGMLANNGDLRDNIYNDLIQPLFDTTFKPYELQDFSDPLRTPILLTFFFETLT